MFHLYTAKYHCSEYFDQGRGWLKRGNLPPSTPQKNKELKLLKKMGLSTFTDVDVDVGAQCIFK
jgi:hypothetical protein